MRLTPVLILGLLTAVPALSQQPRTLADVRRIWLMTAPHHSIAMDNALFSQIKQSGAFGITLNAKESAEAILVPLYGCDTRTGEFLPEAQGQTKRGLCTVTLIDSVAEDADGGPVRIWAVRPGIILDLYFGAERLKETGQPVDIQAYVAKGVVADLLADREASLAGQVPTPVVTLPLAGVKAIFVSLGDYSYETAGDKLLEEKMYDELVRKLVVKEGGKKKLMVRRDSNGVESILPGVLLVNSPALADAILIGPYTERHAGPVFYTSTGDATTTLNSDASRADTDISIKTTAHQRVIEVGTVILFDRRTRETIWSATKNDYQWWVGVLAGGLNTGPATVVGKLVKQLRKDYEKAVSGRY